MQNEAEIIGGIRGAKDRKSRVPRPLTNVMSRGSSAVSETTARQPETAPERTAVTGRRSKTRTGASGQAGRAGVRATGASLHGQLTAAPATPTHIADLTPDPQNRRKHNPRNIGMVVDALHQVGAARSVVIDEDGVVLAGNGTIEAAAEAGITKVQVVDADGETIIAVRRSGLSAEQKRALSLFDNRAAELASWDLDQLRADVDAGLDMAAFFAPVELADLLGAAAPVPEFQPVSEEAQGRLDQLQLTTTCPACGHSFTPEAL